MVAEQNKHPKTVAPGTVGAMASGNEASQEVSGMRTPIPQPDAHDMEVTPVTSSGSGLESGVGATPGAESNSSGQGSVPATRRDHKRVKARLVNFNDLMRQKFKYLHESVQKERK